MLIHIICSQYFHPAHIQFSLLPDPGGGGSFLLSCPAPAADQLTSKSTQQQCPGNALVFGQNLYGGSCFSHRVLPNIGALGCHWCDDITSSVMQ